ncbi:MAG TPA: hypothetical protein VG365_03785 [Solirubrobacteraceae bacterium]|jgi:hypothetical protein|nr:hypothetical protein [Solirubrobacteraceae bacterium]
MRRRYVIASIGLAVVLFVVISGLLARAIGVGDAQNAAITELVRAEVRGDAHGVISLISGCKQSAACRARAAQLAAALRRPGSLSILQVQPSTNVAVTGSVGTARVAWLAGSSLPRVQCVRVRNAGNVLAGFTIEILQVSPKLAVSGASCPSRF